MSPIASSPGPQPGGNPIPEPGLPPGTPIPPLPPEEPAPPMPPEPDGPNPGPGPDITPPPGPSRHQPVWAPVHPRRMQDGTPRPADRRIVRKKGR